MKVTALIPDSLISQVQLYAKASTITESIKIALQQWISLKKIEQLNKKVKAKPLEFSKGFSAERARQLTR